MSKKTSNKKMVNRDNSQHLVPYTRSGGKRLSPNSVVAARPRKKISYHQESRSIGTIAGLYIPPEVLSIIVDLLSWEERIPLTTTSSLLRSVALRRLTKLKVMKDLSCNSLTLLHTLTLQTALLRLQVTRILDGSAIE